MTAPDAYVAGLKERLAADGCAVSHEKLGSRPVLVGYKAQTRALARMHVFTVAMAAGRVEESDLRTYVDAAVELAGERKGQWRGLQSGVIVLPVLVATGVDESAVALTQKAYRLNLGGFAVLAQPAVVDVTAGRVWTFRGTRLWGYAFNALIKQKYRSYLPDPVA